MLQTLDLRSNPLADAGVLCSSLQDGYRGVHELERGQKVKKAAFLSPKPGTLTARVTSTLWNLAWLVRAVSKPQPPPPLSLNRACTISYIILYCIDYIMLYCIYLSKASGPEALEPEVSGGPLPRRSTPVP